VHRAVKKRRTRKPFTVVENLQYDTMHSELGSSSVARTAG